MLFLGLTVCEMWADFTLSGLGWFCSLEDFLPVSVAFICLLIVMTEI